MLVEFGLENKDDRREKMDYGGGSTIDMGVYCVNFAQWVFGGKPTKVSVQNVLKGHIKACQML